MAIFPLMLDLFFNSTLRALAPWLLLPCRDKDNSPKETDSSDTLPSDGRRPVLIIPSGDDNVLSKIGEGRECAIGPGLSSP
mmetsp:Transcript_26150/g.44097  ORF Transcript_26150/g.44097 Transcript_26150/m.44097 type:complete len:81 (+) Transcript_26150:486-728(+)